MAKRIMLLVLLALSTPAFADTPPPGTVGSRTYDGNGNKITSTVNGLARGLDCNISNAASTPGLTSTVFGGSVIDPRNIRPLTTTTDQLLCGQLGSWSVIVSSSALPTGAATEAKQDAGNTHLTNIDLKTPALGQAVMADSVPVTIASDQSPVDVGSIAGPVALPTGASTEATLSTLNGKVTNTTGGAIKTDSSAFLQPVHITDGVNAPAIKGAATAPVIADPSLVVAISPNSPISVTSVPPVNGYVTGSLTADCPTGASCPAGSTVQVLTNGTTTVGYETHGTWSATVTTDVSYDPTCDSAPATALWLNTASIDTDSNQALYVTSWGSGLNDDPWVFNVAGALCARVRAVAFVSGSVDVTMTTGVGTAMVWAISVGNVRSGTADAGNPVKVGGRYNLALPTFSDGQRGDLQLDVNGRLIATVNGISGVISLPTGAATELTLSSVDTKLTTTNSTLSTIDTDIKASQPRKLQDGAGNAVTSQASGGQRALDVGVNVAGVQVDPRDRNWSLLSGTDSVTTIQGTNPWVTSRNWTLGAGTDAATVTQGPAAALAGYWPTRITDGTNTMPTMDTVGRAGFTKLTDGTNTTAVKAASTAALATDPSAVVALSPNSPIPAGAADIGSIHAIQSGIWTVQQGATPTTNANGWAVKPGDGTNTQGYTASSEAKVLVTPLTNSSVVKAQLQDNSGAAITNGQKTMANSVPVVLASDQTTVHVDGTGTTGTPAGGILSVQGTANTDKPVIVAGSTAVGSPPVNNPIAVSGVDGSGNKQHLKVDATGKVEIDSISGTVTLPTNAATESSLAKLTQTQGSTTATQSGPLVQGAVTTAAPSYTTAQTSPLSLTTAGGLRSDMSSVAGTTTATGNGVVGAGVQRVAIASDNSNVPTNIVQVAGAAPSATNPIPARVTDGTNFAATFQNITGSQATVSSPGQMPGNYSLHLGWDGTTHREATVDTSGNSKVVGNVANGTTDSGAPVKVGAIYESAQTAVTTGQRSDVHVTKFGDLTTGDNTSFSNITTATTTTVKSGAGLLYAICFNLNVNNATVTIYDNTAGSGTKIGTVTTVLGGGADSPKGCSRYNGVNFATGLTIVTSAATDITVLYK